MIKSRRDSCIEIWSDKYINNPKDRNSEDLDKDIIQIEPAGGDQLNFIVEVIKKKEADDGKQ